MVYEQVSQYVSISIHAPVKGATVLFQLAVSVAQRISIHAPVKGATLELRWPFIL